MTENTENLTPARDLTSRWNTAGRALAARAPSVLDALVSLAEFQLAAATRQPSMFHEEGNSRTVTSRCRDVEALVRWWEDIGSTLAGQFAGAVGAMRVVLEMAEGAVAEIGP